MHRTKQELGSFYKQFDYGITQDKSCNGQCSKFKPRKYYKKDKYYEKRYIAKPSKEEYYRKKSYKPHNKYRKKVPINKTQNKKSFKDLICFNCGQKGHTSRFVSLIRN